MTKDNLIFKNLDQVLKAIDKASKEWVQPVVGTFASGRNSHFKILISTLISLRTKDKVTKEASHRLFALAETPADMLKLSIRQIEKAIYPAGFYHTKAKNILHVCDDLLKRFRGRVPDDIEDLLSLRGVGRKTANLVVTVGYNKPGICVDTHVHRISNRWGLVNTKTPEGTEQALRRLLPKRYWVQFNDRLVVYGQNLCVPISPFCSRCSFARYCPQKGVVSHR